MYSFEKIISALFPKRCAICDEAILPYEMVCPECRIRIRPISGDTCRKCGKALSDKYRLTCYDCSRKIHYFDRGYAIFEYADVKKSLYRFKYLGRAEYAKCYAYYANEILGDVIRDLNADALIPVPIHKKRLTARGYNQAEVLAKEMSPYFNIPVITDYVIRSKYTVPLKKLDERGRINNLKKAFTIGSNGVKLDTIVIIDDIYTTGSTIDAISRLCRESGVRKIVYITVAIGKGL